MKKAAVMVVALAALAAVALVPALSSAEHCTDVFIFQGVSAGGVSRGLNTGFFGCTVDPNDESLNTNVVIPGAQVALVGVADPFVPLAGSSTLTIGSSVTPLTWTHNDVQGRWDSQPVSITEVANMTAFADLGGGDSLTVTYHTVP